MNRASLLSALALSTCIFSCAPRPAIELRPKGAPPQPEEAPRNAAVVTVQRPRGTEITVDAKSPRTPIGHVRPGARVRISVIEARWTNDPGAPLVGAEGGKEMCSSSGQHECIAGHHVAPIMGLVLISESIESAPPGPACTVRDRIPAPDGVEFEAPEEADLLLAPNDWEDGLSDNRGALEVEVEIGPSKAQKPTSRSVVRVDARERAALAAHVLRGQYVRITPKGGSWSHVASGKLVGAAGSSGERCQGVAGHRCIGGDGVAPTMGLVVLVAPCGAASRAPRRVVTRAYIPWGTELLADREADLFLAPNDWEDGLFNNAGSARVTVEITQKGP
jgi:hypothetical protein